MDEERVEGVFPVSCALLTLCCYKQSSAVLNAGVVPGGQHEDSDFREEGGGRPVLSRL